MTIQLQSLRKNTITIKGLFGCKNCKCRQTVVAPCDQATWLARSSIWSPEQRPPQTNSLNRKTEEPERKSRVGVGGGCGGCEWSGPSLQERARSLVSFVCAQELTLPRIHPLPLFLSLSFFPSFYLTIGTKLPVKRERLGNAFINPVWQITNNFYAS